MPNVALRRWIDTRWPSSIIPEPGASEQRRAPSAVHDTSRGKLCGLDVGEEAADLAIEAFGLLRERVGERLDVGRGGASVTRGAGETAHGLGAGACFRGCAVDAFADRGNGTVLLLDRNCDSAGNLGDFLDEGVDLLELVGRVRHRRLDGADLAGDLLGGLGSLAGERLDL